jgi:hypothetical protein
VNWEGSMEFHDHTNDFHCRINFGPAKKKGIFSKQVGKLHDMTGQIRIGSIPVAEIRGSWLTNLVIGNTEYWNIDRDRPSYHIFDRNPLPSDWRFREDLVYLTKGNKVLA